MLVFLKFAKCQWIWYFRACVSFWYGYDYFLSIMSSLHKKIHDFFMVFYDFCQSVMKVNHFFFLYHTFGKLVRRELVIEYCKWTRESVLLKYFVTTYRTIQMLNPNTIFVHVFHSTENSTKVQGKWGGYSTPSQKSSNWCKSVDPPKPSEDSVLFQS